MKSLTFLLFGILFSMTCLSMDEETARYISQNKDDVFEKISQSDEFKKLLQSKFPGVKEEELFEKLAEDKTKQEEIENEIFNNWDKFAPLLTKKLKTQDGRAPGNNQKGLEFKETNISALEREMKPHIKALGEHYQKKLREALYGKEEQKNEVGHSVYYDLMESQLGKNVIYQLTNYCFNANPENSQDPNEPKFAVPEDLAKREANRKAHLKTLKVNGKSLEGSRHFNLCITSIKFIAENKIKCDRENPATGEREDVAPVGPAQDQCPDPNKDTLSNFKDGYSSEHQNQAKIVMDNISRLRNALVETQKIKEAYAKTDCFDASSNQKRKDCERNRKIKSGDYGIKQYDRSKKGASIDEITHISSGEYLSAKGEKGPSVEELLAQRKKEFEDKCKGKQNKAQMQECLEQFNDKDKENLDELHGEMAARSIAYAAKIRNMDTDEFKDRLKQEGRSDQEIEEIMEAAESDKAIFEKLKKEAAKRVREAKFAIMEKQRKDLRLQIQKDQVTPETLGDIEKELATQAEAMADLIHYSNVVSSYLDIDSGNGETERNTAALVREMNSKNSYLGREKADGKGTYGDADVIKEKDKLLQAAGEDASSDSNTQLGVDQINKIILDTK